MIARVCHRIGDRKHGSNFNTIEELQACTDILVFDGIYTELLEYIEELRGKRITLAIVGKYVGKDNSFDIGQPYGRFCDWNEIMKLVTEWRADLAYHSYSHVDLSKLSTEEVLKEITPPIPMTDFVYPGGYVDNRLADLVKAAGYLRGWGVNTNSNDAFKLDRRYLNW